MQSEKQELIARWKDFLGSYGLVCTRDMTSAARKALRQTHEIDNHVEVPYETGSNSLYAETVVLRKFREGLLRDLLDRDHYDIRVEIPAPDDYSTSAYRVHLDFYKTEQRKASDGEDEN